MSNTTNEYFNENKDKHFFGKQGSLLIFSSLAELYSQ